MDDTGRGPRGPIGKLPPAASHTVTIYSPAGAAVTVFQADARELLAQGYTRTAPVAIGAAEGSVADAPAAVPSPVVEGEQPKPKRNK